MSAPILFLIGLLVLGVAGGATFGIAQVIGVDDDSGDGGEGQGSVTSTTPTSDPSLTPEQVSVSGTVSAMTIEGAVLSEVTVPSVVTPSAGLGAGARFEDVLVDGETSTIAWDAGRPLVFGEATPLRVLLLAPVSLTADLAGIVVTFAEGAVHGVAPADYGIIAPVAVSSGGLARPRDAVDFTASAATTVAFTGGANSTIAPIPMSVTGPGRVVLEGQLLLRRPDGTTTEVTRVELPTGSYRVAFTPRVDATGYDLTDALLEGTITAT